jgi:hypothetical protein
MTSQLVAHLAGSTVTVKLTVPMAASSKTLHQLVAPPAHPHKKLVCPSLVWNVLAGRGESGLCVCSNPSACPTTTELMALSCKWWLHVYFCSAEMQHKCTPTCALCIAAATGAVYAVHDIVRYAAAY